MGFGTGNTQIDLCNDVGVMQHTYTIDGDILVDLVQIVFNKEYDTSPEQIKLDSGDIKEIIRGEYVFVDVPVRLVSGFTVAGWETFLFNMLNWRQTIKIIPHIDEAAKIYWVTLLNSYELQESIRYLRQRGVLKFKGAEFLTAIPT